jgi:hypothetical protein
MKRIFATLSLALIAAAPLAAQGPSNRNMERGIKGEVTVVNEFTNQVTVKTSQVPGMNGRPSTVAFIAKDNEIMNYKVGDKVTGDLVTEDNDTYLENVKVTASATKTDSTPAGGKKGVTTKRDDAGKTNTPDTAKSSGATTKKY